MYITGDLNGVGIELAKTAAKAYCTSMLQDAESGWSNCMKCCAAIKVVGAAAGI